MISEITAIATDCDYTLMQPSFTPYVRPFYRLLRKISNNWTERLIQTISGLPEYLIEELFFRINPFTGNPLPLVNVEVLAEAHRKFIIGVYSRRPKTLVKEDLRYLGYSRFIDVVVSREDVGMMGTIRREYIAKCLQELGTEPENTLVVSDSPKDIWKGKSIGAKTSIVPSYHSERELIRCESGMPSPSFEKLLEKLMLKI